MTAVEIGNDQVGGDEMSSSDSGRVFGRLRMSTFVDDCSHSIEFDGPCGAGDQTLLDWMIRSRHR